MIYKREKHKFDLSIVEEGYTDTWQRRDDGELYEIIFPGYKCIKCGKILWLDASEMFHLPRSMRYCDNADFESWLYRNGYLGWLFDWLTTGRWNQKDPNPKRG